MFCVCAASDQRVSCPGCCWADVCDSGSAGNQRAEVNTTHSVVVVVVSSPSALSQTAPCARAQAAVLLQLRSGAAL